MSAISNVDLRLLRVFTTIVDCGGFSAAQAELNISQSTISNHILALEDRLRFKLCQRGRSGFELTDQGRHVYDSALKLFAAVDEFRTEADSLQGQLTGDLRIGVVDNTVTDSKSPVIEAIRRFTSRSSNANLRVSMYSPPALQKQLIDRHLDLAILGIVHRLPTLRYQNLYTETCSLYCGDRHPLFELASTPRLDEVREYPFVSRSYWRDQDVDRIGALKVAAAVEHMEAQLMMVLSGSFLAFLPDHYAQRWVDQGRLRSVLSSELAYSVRLQAVSKKGVRTSPALKAFMNDLYTAMGDLNKPTRTTDNSTAAPLYSWQSCRGKRMQLHI